MDRRTFIWVTATAGAGLGTAWWGKPENATSAESDVRGPGKVSSQGGVLATTLEAAPATLSLGHRQANLYAFNGRVPGPVLEMRPGDTLRLRFTNRLPEAANLHYHGLHVPPTGHADNIFLQIPAGESLQYEFRVPADHPAGLFWYHPHLHGSVARHLARGLAGPLVLRGELDAIPEVAAAREHVLVLQDFSLDTRGNVQEPGMMERMQGREGELVTVNASRETVLPIQNGGLLRLRLLNASPSRFYRLSLEDHPLHLIGTDGGGISAPVSLDELLLLPGERADLLVRGERREGDFHLLAQPYDRIGDMSGMMGMMGRMGGGTQAPLTALRLATVRYQGSAQRPISLPEKLVRVDPLPAPVRVRRVVLGMNMGMRRGMAFLIDGREFDHERVDARVRLGDVEDWEYVNDTPMDHPMHLHINPFQLIEGGQPVPRWKDVVMVKANGSARVRVAFKDFPGRTVHHCHILDHEDMGMMATVQMEG